MQGRIKVPGSDVVISRLGLGCARIYGGSEFSRSAALVEACLSAGVRHFDTAPPYGEGQSEGVLGEILRGVNDITIATKVGIPATGGNTPWARVAYRRFVKPALTLVPGIKSRLLQISARKTVAESVAAPKRRLERSLILHELENSLRRLKRERVDIYLVHEPDQFELDDEALECFETLARQGVIGAFGLAYGRVTEMVPDFGTVIQSQYCGEREWGADNRAHIFHGLLRHGWRDPARQSKDQSVGAFVGGVLEANPDSAVLFSASSRRQIHEVTSMATN
jgi:aryl-alcohol dehydrogenase-like predicted oxidoreductase